MGRTHLAVGVLLGFIAAKVWGGSEPATAREVVTVRDARIELPRLERAPVIANAEEMGIVEVPGEIREIAVPARTFEAVLGQADDDGLTDEQRREGRIAEIEDGLRLNRGAIHGQVRDMQSDERLAGVTVTVTSPALAGAQSAITDEHGYYEITDLPVGNYLVTFYYLDTTVERSGIDLWSGHANEVSQRLQQQPYEPVVVTLDHHDEGVSFTGVESQDNQYYVDSIDVSGLTFGEDL